MSCGNVYLDLRELKSFKSKCWNRISEAMMLLRFCQQAWKRVLNSVYIRGDVSEFVNVSGFINFIVFGFVGVYTERVF